MRFKHDETELLRDAAQALYPIENGIVTPLADLPDPETSREGLARNLANCEGIRKIGCMILMNESMGMETLKEIQLKLPFDNPLNHPENYNIKQYTADLPSILEENPNRLFIGPLILEDTFYPNGIGVYEVIPADAGKE